MAHGCGSQDFLGKVAGFPLPPFFSFQALIMILGCLFFSFRSGSCSVISFWGCDYVVFDDTIWIVPRVAFWGT